MPPGSLRLGELTGPDHQRTGEPLEVGAAELTTHGVIVGMTGSGKTGLGIVLVEEALLQGIPTLVLDPKGDLGNLALTFPDLAPADFAPWADGADPAEVAATWRRGLADWGQDGSRVRALRDAAPVTIYTPGSTSGVGLDVVGSLRRPAAGADPEAVADEVQGYVSGLLGLVGVDADPLASPAHILLANLVHRAWEAGQDLDLAGLVGQVRTPPLRQLGVFPIDEFIPPDERMALAVRLNGLLASPSFAAWAQGEPVDIERLLGVPGRPRCAVVTLSHLTDDERQLVITQVLAKLVTWMRRQPGTDQLRVLVYFDEVAGFVPPTAVPPSKRPLLTLLKQARAFGVGLVLATQNPVDLDYRALSNAGTWMVGRLQTEQDRDRLLTGLSSAGGDVDVAGLGGTIAALDRREFVVRRAGRGRPATFATRWALSYLRGPLTREQIGGLMAGRRSDGAPPPSVPARLDDTATPVMPAVADGVPVRWLDPAAPWAADVGADVTAATFAAGVVATVDLTFDDDRAGLHHTERFECVWLPLTDPPDAAALVATDHDPRDLRPEAPEGARYWLPDAPLRRRGYFTALQRRLVEHLLATRTTTLHANPALRLFSRPGEALDAFTARCAGAADDGADRQAASVAKAYATRLARAGDALAAAEDRLDQAEAVRASRHTDELVSGAGDLLGSLLGTRRRARGVARRAGSLARRRGRSSEAAARVGAAANRVEERRRALDDLEDALADELASIADEWDARAAAIEVRDVPLERSDVRVVDLALVWMPVRHAPGRGVPGGAPGGGDAH